MIRVLHIFNTMANGGIENFVMEYYRNIDRNKVQFDFLVSTYEKGYYDEEIIQMGGRIFHACPKNKNLIKNFFDTKQVVKEHNYSIVHRHTGSAIAKFDLYAAKMGGAKHLILHSHNTKAGRPLLHKISNLIFREIRVEQFACSKDAGIFLFDQDNFKIIPNAIKCEKYKYDKTEREKIRASLGWDNCLVIGHVGKFLKAKNHFFILKIFQEFLKTDKNAKLVLVGTGENYEAVKNKIYEERLENSVILLGNRTDVNLLLQAFDVFLFPSLFEGLPFVLVEAQTSGLPCVVSTNVPEECNVSGEIKFLDLNCDMSVWVEAIKKKVETNNDASREIAWKKVRDEGFDISTCANDLMQIYLNYSNK